jgi:hypothetical protein
VAIARALVRDPSILLLDEATSALDPKTERQISATLDRVGREKTVIAITHRLTSVVDYDRIFVVVDGRLAEQGSHAELVATGGVYAHLWAEQTGEPVVAPAEPGVFERPPLAGLLGSAPIFRELDDAALARLAEMAQPFALDEGDVLRDPDGLVVVTVGAAQVQVPTPGGGERVATELGPGGVFGVERFLGGDPGSSLAAAGPVQLVQLGGDDLRALAAELPALGARLAGRRTAAPSRGTRLSRVTLGPRPAGTASSAAGGRAGVDGEARATGSFSRATSMGRPT